MLHEWSLDAEQEETNSLTMYPSRLAPSHFIWGGREYRTPIETQRTRTKPWRDECEWTHRSYIIEELLEKGWEGVVLR